MKEAECGLMITFSMDQKGWFSGSGSFSNTSSAAPAMRCSESASTNAFSFTTEALAILMKKEVFSSEKILFSEELICFGGGRQSSNGDVCLRENVFYLICRVDLVGERVIRYMFFYSKYFCIETFYPLGDCFSDAAITDDGNSLLVKGIRFRPFPNF